MVHGGGGGGRVALAQKVAHGGDGEIAGDLAGLVPPHPVGHQVEAEIVVQEYPVFVGLPSAPDIGEAGRFQSEHAELWVHKDRPSLFFPLSPGVPAADRVRGATSVGMDSKPSI